jgi:hypothetical protein
MTWSLSTSTEANVVEHNDSLNSWAIGIYEGFSPLSLQPAPGIQNPVLSRLDVADVAAAFVADPFMLQVDGSWHMFFEVLDRREKKGKIGLATGYSGTAWSYQGVVLGEPFHVSYPYVFESDGEVYMVPESRTGSIRLYRADRFPFKWSLAAELLEGPGADPSVFRFDGLWWMFVCEYPGRNDILRLFFARELTGSWNEHPKSPMVRGDNRRARPAGRVITDHDRVIRFAQDCYPRYGTQVRAFEVTELSARQFRERELDKSPVLGPSGGGWNSEGMHHIDLKMISPDRWRACVDGRSWVGPIDELPGLD